MIANRLFRRTAGVLAAGAAALVLVSACSAGSDTRSGSAGAPPPNQNGSTARDSAGKEVKPGGSPAIDPAALAAPSDYMVRSALLALRV